MGLKLPAYTPWLIPNQILPHIHLCSYNRFVGFLVPLQGLRTDIFQSVSVNISVLKLEKHYLHQIEIKFHQKMIAKLEMLSITSDILEPSFQTWENASNIRDLI